MTFYSKLGVIISLSVLSVNAYCASDPIDNNKDTALEHNVKDNYPSYLGICHNNTNTHCLPTSTLTTNDRWRGPSYKMPSHITLTNDGNLVVNTYFGDEILDFAPIWQSETNGMGITQFKINNYGSPVFLNKNNEVVYHLTDNAPENEKIAYLAIFLNESDKIPDVVNIFSGELDESGSFLVTNIPWSTGDYGRYNKGSILIENKNKWGTNTRSGRNSQLTLESGVLIFTGYDGDRYIVHDTNNKNITHMKIDSDGHIGFYGGDDYLSKTERISFIDTTTLNMPSTNKNGDIGTGVKMFANSVMIRDSIGKYKYYKPSMSGGSVSFFNLSDTKILPILRANIISYNSTESEMIESKDFESNIVNTNEITTMNVPYIDESFFNKTPTFKPMISINKGGTVIDYSCGELTIPFDLNHDITIFVRDDGNDKFYCEMTPPTS